MVWIMSSFPGGRVELQSKEGLDVLHHSATQVDLCPVHLPGKHPASRPPSQRSSALKTSKGSFLIDWDLSCGGINEGQVEEVLMAGFWQGGTYP